jgi:hypothetical protein
MNLNLPKDFDDYGFLGIQAEEFSRDILKKYKEWFGYCYELNSFCQRVKFEIEIHNRDGQEVISCCLFLKILNGFQACLILSRYGLVLEAEVLVRSILEALFIMRACIDDEEFMRDYVNSDKLRQLNIMKAAHRHTKWIFEATREAATKERIDRLIEMKKGGEIKKLEIREIARKAGLEPLYDSAYSLLSDSVHSGPKSVDVYLGTDGRGYIRRISMIPEKIEMEIVFVTAIQTVLLALGGVFKLFEINRRKDLEAFDLRFQEIAAKETVSS